MTLALLLILGFVAGTVGGVIGFGSSIMLMPALVLMYGPRTAVPLMAVTALVTNASRVALWWREVDWRACAAYSITAIPAAALGAKTLVTIPPRLADGVLGAFFMPFLSVTLLWLLNKKHVPQEWRNKVASNAVMVVIAAAFIALAVNELQKAVRGA